MKFVVIISGEYAVGLFDTREDAQRYVDTDWCRERMTVMEFTAPARDWRKQQEQA